MIAGWPPGVDPAAPDALAGHRAVTLLADPFTFPPDARAGSNGAGMSRDLMGGIASGGRTPGGHRLMLNQRVMSSGDVGVAIAGVVPVVSQGCRPGGLEMTITDGGRGSSVRWPGARRPPAPWLSRTCWRAWVSDENRPEYRQGDYLIRGILGGDPESDAIAVGDHVRVGQVIHLQVRDQASAGADLRATLTIARSTIGGQRAAPDCSRAMDAESKRSQSRTTMPWPCVMCSTTSRRRDASVTGRSVRCADAPTCMGSRRR